MTTPSQVPVPSGLPQDLRFNAEKFDQVITGYAPSYTDRLGGVHYTIAGLKADYDNVVANLAPLGKVYSTLSAANAAIASGEIANGTTFFVRSPTDASIADEYQNLSGTATATGRSYPSMETIEALPAQLENGEGLASFRDKDDFEYASFDSRARFNILGIEGDVATNINNTNADVASLEGKIFDQESTDILWKVVDKNEESTGLYLDTKCQLFVSGMEKSIQQTFNDIQGGTGADAGTSQLKESARFTDYAMIQEKDSVETGIKLVSITEVGGVQVRIPSLLRVAKSEYLLFFERRNSIADYPEAGDTDFGPNDIMMMRFTADSVAKTFSSTPAVSVADHYLDTDGYEYSCINACSVKLDSGRIILLYVERRIGVTPKGKFHRFVKRYSDDNGVTWSDKVDLSSSFPMDQWNVLAPGPGIAIVKRFGDNKGRIVVPAWHASPLYPDAGAPDFYRAGMLYSDDNGETFQIGPFYTNSTNEVQCAEDINGNIVFVMRTNTNRILNVVPNGTLEMQPLVNDGNFGQLALMAGLVQGQNKYDGSAPKLQLITAFGKVLPTDPGRSHLMIHTSYNGGSNWVSSYLVNASDPNALTGYSGIASLTPLYRVALWETNSYREFQVRIISMKNLLEG